VLLVLHSRDMGNVWQRLSLVAPGIWGAIAMIAVEVAGTEPSGRILPAVGVASAGAAFIIAGWIVPGRRLVPYWGRAAELLHSLVAISLLPLALWVLGVYGELRAIG
jgi:EccD-like transmembrane domain